MDDSNLAVVLLCGGPIAADSEWRTVARIDFAVELALKLDGYLLVSSGVSGHEVDVAARPESHLYIQELTRRYSEFPRARLFVEDFSRDTVGNVYFSVQVLKAVLRPKARVIWVSSKFHSDRLRVIVAAIEGGTDWTHEVASVTKSPPSQELLVHLEEIERASIERFTDDLMLSTGIEELLFCRHDFYSVDRLLKEKRCV